MRDTGSSYLLIHLPMRGHRSSLVVFEVLQRVDLRLIQIKVESKILVFEIGVLLSACFSDLL